MPEQQQTLWDSNYLLVKDVSDGDVIEVVELIGFVESFGKKKYSIKVLHNGIVKICNLNRYQYNASLPLRAGGKYQCFRVAVNGGISLNFKAL